MNNIEVEGRDKDEAISKGLTSLGLTRAQVNIEVLDEGGRGFLGFGSKQVKVRLRALDEGEVDPGEVVRSLLEMMDVEFELQVSSNGEETDIRIDAPKDDGLLIGRRGQTLDALRHITQRIVAARKGHNMPVNIDVGDYRARRESGLVEKAEEAAAQVLEAGRPVTLDPMSAQDRRVIHLALADRKGIATHTVGHGSRRRVVVTTAEESTETAYDNVPDPGFRSQRMGTIDVAEAERPREERRDGGERPERRRGGRGRRPQREQGETRADEGPVVAAEGNREERREGRRSSERGSRGRDGDRGRDRGRRDDRGRDSDSDRFDDGQASDGPVATKKEDLSQARVVTDDSGEKAFPSDVAKRILQLDKSGSGSGSKRRRRR